MHLIVYGDFNCPHCYLASQRVDALRQAGQAEVEWRAVEHDRQLALTGTPANRDAERWQRELAEAATLAGPGERVPAAVPPLISNTCAAVAAYAEAVTDGVSAPLRRLLLSEIWVRQRHLSSAHEVRKLVRTVMAPAGPPATDGRLAAPDLPSQLHHQINPGLLPRLSGATISTDGGPLTTQGYLRIRAWREEWLAGSGGVAPALSLDGGMLTGRAALAHLASLGPAAPAAGPAAPS